MEIDCLKKSTLSSRRTESSNEEKAIAINGLRLKYLLSALLDFYKIEKSSCYYTAKAIKTAEIRDKDIQEEILDIYNKSHCRYGFKRITLEINKYRTTDNRINPKCVLRIMHKLGIFVIRGRNSKCHSYTGDNRLTKENLSLEKVVYEDKYRISFKRHFEATRPNEKWTTDVSEFKHKDGKLYLSPILDMFNGSIIAYDLSEHPDFYQTKRMIDKGLEQYKNLDGLKFHSNQGCQYQMKQYSMWLKSKGIKQSFSRKGNCMDNSLMENFFGLLKNEMFYGHESDFKTLDDLRNVIDEYIKWYSEERINVKRKGLSPLEYRQQSFSQL